MRGKLLENIVLLLGLLVIASASFLMFIDKTGTAAKSINIIFSTGFIIYIVYSYILSKNLNGEIYDLKKHVSNLKEEVTRLKSTIKKRDASIAQQKAEINTLTDDLQRTRVELEGSKQKFEETARELEALKDSISKEK